ncbi:MAG: hypothetical protein LC620_02775 [Halobacteriales archaeon]|nr:hypothetical protein [Halobacteriales archaeon]
MAGATIRVNYGYDRNDQRTSAALAMAPTFSTQYTYDSLNRLTGYLRGNWNSLALPATALPDSMASNAAWSLDGANNWGTSTRQVGAATTTSTDAFGPTNDLQSRNDGNGPITFTKDDDGNRLQDGTYKYSYDAFNRLRTVKNANTNALIGAYNYDALGRRIQKAVASPSSTTQYYYDGVNAIEERNGAGTLLRQFVYGDKPDMVIEMDRVNAGNQRLYYVRDAQGSTMALLDNTGHAKEGYLYEPHGSTVVVKPGANGVLDWGGDDTTATVSALENPITYTGQWYAPLKSDTFRGLTLLHSWSLPHSTGGAFATRGAAWV